MTERPERRRFTERMTAGWIALLTPALLLAACGPSQERQDGPPSVLLVTVDTLRADRVGAWGCELETTPTIDRLAAEGVRFSDCTVQWPKTWPSMASFLTGLYPASSGLRLTPRRIPDPLETLGEVFQAAGYRTGAVVANFNVGRTMGFEQGFEHFVESWEEGWRNRSGGAEFRNAPGLVKLFTNAETVTDQALRWLDTLPAEEPFFLWLHYMDPHGPYLPPEGYGQLFVGAHEADPVALEQIPPYQRQRRGANGPPIVDLGFYRTQYDRCVRSFDDQLARLFMELDARGRGKRLLTMLGADHGESLGEHDYFLEHGRFSYQVNAHTPLLYHWPGVVPAGLVVEKPVGMIDAGRTLLELAGLAPPPVAQGHSLTALVLDTGAGAAPQYVYLESGEHENATQRSVRRGRWKLIEVRAPAERALMAGTRYELYDVVADPGEVDNLAQQQPELTRELAEHLRAWFAELPRPEQLPAAVDVEAFGQDQIELLEALGYH